MIGLIRKNKYIFNSVWVKLKQGEVYKGENNMR